MADLKRDQIVILTGVMKARDIHESELFVIDQGRFSMEYPDATLMTYPDARELAQFFRMIYNESVKIEVVVNYGTSDEAREAF